MKLQCPHCPSVGMHLTRVDHYDRLREDQPSFVTTSFPGGVGFAKMEPSQFNPSPRRNAVSATFLCEGCGNTHSVDLVQDRGNVYLRVRSAEKPIGSDEPRIVDDNCY